MRCVQRSSKSVSLSRIHVDSRSSYACRPLHAPPGRHDTAIQHFYDKLLHIQDRLKTEPGKTMGTQRHQFVSYGGQ